MYQIGFTRKEQMIVREESGEKKVSWLETHFRIPGFTPFKAKLSKNNKKENDNAPDFYLYMRGNIKKGDTFRDFKIGALWLKQKEDGTMYMTGNMLLGKEEVRLYIKKAEPLFEGEEVKYLYDVFMFTDDGERQEKEDEYEDGYGDTNVEENVTPDVEINEEELPF